MEIRLRDVTISVDDLENRKIGGYINVTNRESEVMYSKKRGMYFKEIMQPGVFKDAIDNNKIPEVTACTSNPSRVKIDRYSIPLFS